ncbi:nucleotide-diphospho-sugar transferase [Fimicolochytrium jonesii]|uniref:nucleotide-diphospho-sugar transferase n=1 Tax=Fimicolochytrium jonesii TaxID=1396493 RepID=UPI0022FF1C76|nr:nucleotide-diphospho-sugar transferase [Fimicolochytrium jonesii]KAI8826817.1 nucleotide-diphospho-sugar transferase [Fimicolochytrium jonesii]
MRIGLLLVLSAFVTGLLLLASQLCPSSSSFEGRVGSDVVKSCHENGRASYAQHAEASTRVQAQSESDTVAHLDATAPFHEEVAVRKIPRIFHQMWIGDATEMPKGPLRSCKRIHNDSSGWKYILWQPHTLLNFFHSGDLDPQFTDFVKNKLRLLEYNLTSSDRKSLLRAADVWRLVVLHHYGGVYVDGDGQCIRSFTDLVENDNEGRECFIGYESSTYRGTLRANGIMGCVPESVTIQYTLDAIHANDALRVPGEAWELTGPKLLTVTGETLENELPWRRLRTEHGQKLGYKVYPSSTFLPVHYTDKQNGMTPEEGLQRAKDLGSYMVHLWGSTLDAYMAEDGDA